MMKTLINYYFVSLNIYQSNFCSNFFRKSKRSFNYFEQYLCLHGALRCNLFQLKTVANKEYEYIESINKPFFIVDG